MALLFGSPSRNTSLRILKPYNEKQPTLLCPNPRYDAPNYVDYKTRLITLNLLPTSYRREIIDIILFLKSLHDKTNLDLTNYLTFPD